MHKNTSRPLVASLCLIFSAHSQSQVDILPSQQGFSGLTFTPNAQVLTTGRGNLSFAQGVPYKNSIADLDSWFINVGLFPHFEAGGRIVTETYNSNCFTEGCGIRDLSASAKFQLPYLYDLTGFNLAFGAQDIGGAANNFAAYYMVADTEFDSINLRLSGGVAKSDLSLGILDGMFAGAEWQPLSFVQLTGEYDAQEFNSMIRVMTPQNSLPYGAQLAAQYQLYSGHENQDQSLWSINASVPFFGNNFTNNEYKRNKIDSQSQLAIQLAENKSSSVQELLDTLKQEGFVDLRLGSRDGTLVISLENKRYRQNPIDGAGVALGIIATYAGEGTYDELIQPQGAEIKSDQQPIELVLLQNKIPMFAIDTDASCYREFLLNASPCGQTLFSTESLDQKLASTDWINETVNDSFGYSELIFAPVMNYAVATEYGVLDYSIGLDTNLYTPLWKGSAFDIRYILPIANSDDYDDGYYQSQALENQIDRALLHQAFRLPVNSMTQFSVGYLKGGYYGGQNETQWYSQSGQHNLGFEVGYFEPQDDDGQEDHTPMLANYRYSMAQWNWQFQVQGGEFWQGDQGVKATSSHWLGDTRLDATYLNSEKEQFVTLNVSIPLTFWREMDPGYLQVRGTSEFNVNVQTRVGETHNQLNTGMGQTTNLHHNLDRKYYTRARLNPNYFENNPTRLRNAYFRYLNEVVYDTEN